MAQRMGGAAHGRDQRALRGGKPAAGGAAEPARLRGLRVLHDFGGAVSDPGAFRALPDDWIVGVSDVVGSTKAIEAGRYKAVNMAGAAVISGLMNALATRDFLFAFGGDGAAFALPPPDRAVAERVLSETAAWVRDDLSLSLRVALTTVAALRRDGHDVRAALYAPSPHVSYAMFDGGGVAHAEALMKAGGLHVPAAPEGARPDLSGLSCRWLPIPSRNGAIVSVIVRPGPSPAGGPSAPAPRRFNAAIMDLLGLIGPSDAVHPVPRLGPPFTPFSRGLRLEALASRGDRPLWRRLPAVAAHTVLGFVLFALRLRLGSFHAPTYRRIAGENADVRKFGDGVLLTLDCAPELEARLRAFLEAREADGTVRFGMHRQDAALMTCVVPSYGDDGHFHFIDGAGGGYTAAARGMNR